MKKYFLIASLVIIASVNAQNFNDDFDVSERPEKTERRQPPTVEEQLKQFDDLNLSTDQKKKVKALLENRQTEMKAKRDAKKSETSKSEKSFKKGGNHEEFDQKLAEILSADQLKSYQAKHQNKSKDFKQSKKSK